MQAASAGVYSRPHNAASPHNPQHVSRVRAAVGRGSQARASIAARTMPAPPAFLPPCPVCRARSVSAAVGRAQAPYRPPASAPARTRPNSRQPPPPSVSGVLDRQWYHQPALSPAPAVGCGCVSRETLFPQWLHVQLFHL